MSPTVAAVGSKAKVPMFRPALAMVGENVACCTICTVPLTPSSVMNAVMADALTTEKERVPASALVVEDPMPAMISAYCVVAALALLPRKLNLANGISVVVGISVQLEK